MTYVQIATALGLSTERVRQIEKKAIAKLAHPKNRRIWAEIIQILRELETERAKRESESEIFK